MNNCRICNGGNAGHKIVTETEFGHGDSTHKCYVECECGNRSSQSENTSNYGLFSDKAFRAAIENWNKENPDK